MTNGKKEEKRSIQEGMEKKGGYNPSPSTERPPPPKPRPIDKKRNK